MRFFLVVLELEIGMGPREVAAAEHFSRPTPRPYVRTGPMFPRWLRAYRARGQIFRRRFKIPPLTRASFEKSAEQRAELYFVWVCRIL